jgi:hypothetical protein
MTLIIVVMIQLVWSTRGRQSGDVEDKVVAKPAVYFQVVGRRGECRESSGACKGQETGAGAEFLTEIGAANDDKQNTGKWDCCRISAAPEGQEIHSPCAH